MNEDPTSIPAGDCSADRLLGCANHSTLARRLYKCDEPQIASIGSGIQFDLNLLRKGLAFSEASNFHHALNDGRVRQSSSRVFTGGDLRFGVVESDGNVNLGLAQTEGFLQRARFQMSL